MLGPAGCGKTTLLRILSGERDWLVDRPWEYAESSGVEKRPLADAPHVQVVVPPGQSHRAPAYWPDLRAEVAGGRYRGVVLTVAYGFHTFAQGLQLKGHALYQPGVREPIEDFLTRYLPAQRAVEVQVLKELSDFLETCPKPVWLMTVVAKEDLWWGDRQTAYEFYTTGDYGAEVAALTSALGAGRFRHELALASLVIANFVSPAGELIRRNTAGYDHKAQVESLRRLLELLGGLKSWEAGT